MATPTVVAVGTVGQNTGTGNPTAPGIPAGTALGHVMLAFVVSSDNIVSTVAGFTNKSALTGNNGTIQRFSVFWKWAVGGDTAPAVTHAAGDACSAVIISVSGLGITSGDPFAILGTPSLNASSTTVTATGITPAGTTDLVFWFGLSTINNTSNPNSYSVVGGTNPAFTSRVNNTLGLGANELDFAVQSGPSNTGAATGTRTSTLSVAATPNMGVMFTLNDAGGVPVQQGFTTATLPVLRMLVQGGVQRAQAFMLLDRLSAGITPVASPVLTADDSLGTTDAATTAVSFAYTAADTLGTTDAATRALSLFRPFSADTLGTTDAATTRVSLSRAAVDTLGTTDAVTRAALAPTRAVTDTLGTTDAATKLGVFTRTTSDTLGTTDAASRATVTWVRTAGDTLGTTDATNRATVSPSRSASDTLGTTDAATRAALSRVRAASDTLGTTDAAVTASTGGKTAADTLGTTDAVTRAVISRVRSATDTLGTTDAVNRTVFAPRAATDLLRTTDERVNLSTNPSVELNSNGFFANGGATVTRDNTWSSDGSWSVKVTNVTALGEGMGWSNSALNGIPAVSNQTYTIAATVHGTPGDQFQVRLREGTVTNSFIRETLATLTAIPVGGTIRLVMSNAIGPDALTVTGKITTQTIGAVFWVDEMVIVEGAYNGNYFDGDTNDSIATWTGTPDATTSIGPLTVRTVTFARTAADTLGTTDSVARAARLLVRTAADTLGTTDATARAARTSVRTASDSLGSTDSVSTSSGKAASDTLGTTDSVSRGAISRVRAAADTLGTTDAVGKQGTFARTASDTLGTTDAASRSAALSRAASDTLGTTDAAVRAAYTRVRSAADTLGSTDAATTSTAGSKNATDTLGTTDSASRAAISRVRAATDTLGTTDAAARSGTWTRTVADTLGTTDTAARATYSRTRSATDSLGTNDAATTGGSNSRTASDSLGTSDAATQVRFLPRTVADTLGTTDAVTRTSSRSRACADTLGTTDAVTRLLHLFRTGSDALGTTELATKGAIIRSASDTLGTTDTSSRAAQHWLRVALDNLATTDTAVGVTTSAQVFGYVGVDDSGIGLSMLVGGSGVESSDGTGTLVEVS